MMEGMTTLLLLALLQTTSPQSASAKDLTRWSRDLGSDEIAIRTAADSALTAAGDLARPVLKHVAKGQGEAALRAREILAWLEYAAVVTPYELARIPNLRILLTDPDPAVRRKVLFRTLKSLSPGGFAIYIVAMNDKDPAIRVQAALEVNYDLTGQAHRTVMAFLLNPNERKYAPLRHSYGSTFSSSTEK